MLHLGLIKKSFVEKWRCQVCGAINSPIEEDICQQCHYDYSKYFDEQGPDFKPPERQEDLSAFIARSCYSERGYSTKSKSPKNTRKQVKNPRRFDKRVPNIRTTASNGDRLHKQ